MPLSGVALILISGFAGVLIGGIVCLGLIVLIRPEINEALDELQRKNKNGDFD